MQMLQACGNNEGLKFLVGEEDLEFYILYKIQLSKVVRCNVQKLFIHYSEESFGLVNDHGEIRKLIKFYSVFHDISVSNSGLNCLQKMIGIDRVNSYHRSVGTKKKKN